MKIPSWEHPSSRWLWACSITCFTSGSDEVEQRGLCVWQEWILVQLWRLPQNGIEDLPSHQWKTLVFMNRDFFLPKPIFSGLVDVLFKAFLECFPVGARDCIIALRSEWLALTFQELLKEILESLMSSTESTNQITGKIKFLWVFYLKLSLECFNLSPSTVHRAIQHPWRSFHCDSRIYSYMYIVLYTFVRVLQLAYSFE